MARYDVDEQFAFVAHEGSANIKQPAIWRTTWQFVLVESAKSQSRMMVIDRRSHGLAHHGRGRRRGGTERVSECEGARKEG